MKNYKAICEEANKQYNKFFSRPMEDSLHIDLVEDDYDINTYIENLEDRIAELYANAEDKKAEEDMLKAMAAKNAKEFYATFFPNEDIESMLLERENDYAEEMAHFYFLKERLNIVKRVALNA